MAKPVSVRFTETMSGYISPGQGTFEHGYEQGRKSGTPMIFRLTIETGDIDQFVASADHPAKASGYVHSEALGGRLAVIEGRFNLFPMTSDLNRRTMRYRLFLKDRHGTQMTLSGTKNAHGLAGPEIWSDTTTLYVSIFRGFVEQEGEPSAAMLARGIVHISPEALSRQLATLHAEGGSLADRARGIARFGQLFFGSLWEIYGPSCMNCVGEWQREIPVFTTEGIRDADISVVPFSTQDALGLSLLRFCRKPCDQVVVVIHGLTTSSDMFIMPEHYSLVQFLLDQGYSDVFTVDFRMSNRFPYNLHRHRYNLDDIALYDFPAAFEKIRSLVGGSTRIHVICHCLGSVSFMMSLFGGAVDGIASVISNSVSLTPRVPAWSRVKLKLGPFLVENFTSIEYLNPSWRRKPGLGLGKVLGCLVSAFHRECQVPECHMLSFMWGTGFPAVFRHENLHEVTHRRSGDLYGGTGVHYYRHVSKMVNAGNTAVKYQPQDARYEKLPDNYLAEAEKIETPVLFLTGQENRVFMDSNIICHGQFEKRRPGLQELMVIPGYGHQDVFMGKNCHEDVFPRLVAFLNRHS